ncbi:MAG: iron-containing alcohol dehydrogenase [Campylobacterales bacterium]|nr:iron-containing alcohol dehydrogenase [Campylobacterales bacterium]
MNFTYQNPTLIEFGSKKISQISKLIPQNQKVFVVYGGGSIKKNGVYDQVKEALKNHSWCEFGGIEPNPTKETLDKAIAKGREEKVDYVLAVGGGSVADGCKYIINAFYHDGDGWDLLEGKFQPEKALPLGVVLTLAATGSESNTGAVITKAETKEKRFFHSQFSYPKFAILDPNVLKSLDDRQLANGIIDSFIHVCEQYVTQPHGSLAQDYYSEGLLRGLKELAENYDKRDELWYSNLMWMANQALNGLIGLGVPQDWGTHFIGHELSGLYGIDHGRTLAIIQPQLFRELDDEKKDKLLQMGRNVFGIDTQDPEEVIVKLEDLYSSLNVDLNLSNYMNDENIKENVTTLLEKHGFSKFGDRGTINKQVVEKVLNRALKG